MHGKRVLMLLNLEPSFTGKYALTHLGFRPFFLLAGLFAVVSMFLWVNLYSFNWHGLAVIYPSMTWHAHEMVYGYSVAVLAGFLLTAVQNWTNRQTLHGVPLLVLAGLWLLARILPFISIIPLIFTAFIELLFLIVLTIAISRPILQTKQWQHLGIASKIFLFIPANIVFYLGLLGYWPQGTQIGLYAGFYLVIALIFTLGRRVIPFFIEKGVGCPFQAQNDIWLDRSSLVLLVLFAGFDIYSLVTGNMTGAFITALLAFLQVIVHSFRLLGWYHPNLWRKPLLWVLYIAYSWLILGFLLKFLSLALGLPPYFGIHAFAVGGIGMMTVGMMARVALGHTGRNVFDPPPLVLAIFLLVFFAAFMRVFMTWFMPSYYEFWMLTAQFVWIAAFALFTWHYAPILLKPRVDGRYG